jgi:hypothetical protein
MMAETVINSASDTVGQVNARCQAEWTSVQAHEQAATCFQVILTCHLWQNPWMSWSPWKPDCHDYLVSGAAHPYLCDPSPSLWCPFGPRPYLDHGPFCQFSRDPAVVMEAVQEAASSPHAIRHSPVAPSHGKIRILQKDPARKPGTVKPVPGRNLLNVNRHYSPGLKNQCYLFCIMQKLGRCGKYIRSLAIPLQTSFTVYVMHLYK